MVYRTTPVLFVLLTLEFACPNTTAVSRNGSCHQDTRYTGDRLTGDRLAVLPSNSMPITLARAGLVRAASSLVVAIRNPGAWGESGPPVPTSYLCTAHGTHTPWKQLAEQGCRTTDTVAHNICYSPYGEPYRKCFRTSHVRSLSTSQSPETSRLCPRGNYDASAA